MNVPRALNTMLPAPARNGDDHDWLIDDDDCDDDDGDDDGGDNNNNNNNIFYSSQWESCRSIRTTIILSHKTHAHTHS